MNGQLLICIECGFLDVATKRRLIRSCTALMRSEIEYCLGTEFVWNRLQNTHGWSDQSLNIVLTFLPHHVRVDGCMCELREPTQGHLMWKPLRMPHVTKWFRGLRCCHPHRHEVCTSIREKWREELLEGSCTLNTRLTKSSVG